MDAAHKMLRDAVQSDLDSVRPDGTLELTAREYPGPIRITRPMVVEGHGATFWARQGTVLSIECSGVVHLKNLRVEVTGDESVKGGGNQCAIRVSSGCDIEFENVDVRGSVEGLQFEEGVWRYPTQSLDLGLLAAGREHEFILRLVTATRCSVQSEISGVDADPRMLQPGMNQVRLRVDRLKSDTLLHGRILLKANSLKRWIVISATILDVPEARLPGTGASAPVIWEPADWEALVKSSSVRTSPSETRIPTDSQAAPHTPESPHPGTADSAPNQEDARAHPPSANEPSAQQAADSIHSTPTDRGAVRPHRPLRKSGSDKLSAIFTAGDSSPIGANSAGPSPTRVDTTLATVPTPTEPSVSAPPPSLPISGEPARTNRPLRKTGSDKLSPLFTAGGSSPSGANFAGSSQSRTDETLGSTQTPIPAEPPVECPSQSPFNPGAADASIVGGRAGIDRQTTIAPSELPVTAPPPSLPISSEPARTNRPLRKTGSDKLSAVFLASGSAPETADPAGKLPTQADAALTPTRNPAFESSPQPASSPDLTAFRERKGGAMLNGLFASACQAMPGAAPPQSCLPSGADPAHTVPTETLASPPAEVLNHPPDRSLKPAKSGSVLLGPLFTSQESQEATPAPPRQSQACVATEPAAEPKFPVDKAPSITMRPVSSIFGEPKRPPTQATDEQPEPK